MKEYFLDTNSHMPLCASAQQAYINFQSSIAGFGHPSSPSKPGREAATQLEMARNKIAKLLGAQSSNQIIFTSTCTQACEWGLEIFLNQCNNKFKLVRCSPLEHPAVRYFIYKHSHIKLNLNKNGIIIPESNSDDFTICLHVQNEVGIIQPLENIEGFIFSDMCQSVGKTPIDLKNMNVDIAVFGAHKFGGPASIGILYLDNPSWWKAFGTGSRYFNDRPGTPDVAGIVAAAAALEEHINEMPNKLNKMHAFQKKLEENFTNANIEVICKDSKRVPSTTLIKAPGVAINVLEALGEKKIYVGLGSACGSKHTGESPSMAALGISGGANDFIRISTNGQYDDTDADYVSKIIIEKINYYRSKLCY